ncbi:MAG: NUDIX hydrolase, partial [Candidatus Thorarchaeota archaeon]
MKRLYPDTPVAGVASTVFKDDKVLLVRRLNEPAKGRLGIPGGVVELGEKVSDAAAREVFEETGIVVEPVRVLTVFDSIVRDKEGKIKFHYVLSEYLCKYVSGTLGAESDVSEALWVSIHDLDKQGMSPRNVTFIKKTAREEG